MGAVHGVVVAAVGPAPMKRRRPPGYRQSKPGGRRCANCGSMNKRTGICARYNYPVTKLKLCDTWKPDTR